MEEIIINLYMGMVPLSLHIVEIPGGFNLQKSEVNVKAGLILVGNLTNAFIISTILGGILFPKLMNLSKQKKDYLFGASHEVLFIVMGDFCFFVGKKKYSS